MAIYKRVNLATTWIISLLGKGNISHGTQEAWNDQKAFFVFRGDLQHLFFLNIFSYSQIINSYLKSWKKKTWKVHASYEVTILYNWIKHLAANRWRPCKRCMLTPLKVSLETLERSFHRGEKTEIWREASWDIWNSPLCWGLRLVSLWQAFHFFAMQAQLCFRKTFYNF